MEELKCFLCQSEVIVVVFKAACFCSNCINKQENICEENELEDLL